MRVLLLANHLNTGGIATYVLNLSRGLAARGHKVWVASAGGNCAGLLQGHAQHIDLDIGIKSEVHPKVWLALPHIAAFVREERMDMVHANTRVTQVLSWSIEKVTGVPFVSTCHGFFRPRLFRRIFPCWGKSVIAISRPVSQHLVQDFHLDTAKVQLIANGIDLKQFFPADENERRRRRQQWNAQAGPIIGIVARLSSVKGIDLLIKAFACIRKQFPQAQLWIVGDGPEKQKLRQLTGQMGLDGCVRFEAIVNQTPDVLPVFDIFVMPSVQEGLGLAVMEAQACGIAVVASNVGGLPDLIEDGKTGFLFTSGDTEALAAKIIELLNNPGQAQAMAVAARRQVEKKFSLDQMVEQTIALYEQNISR